MYQYHLVSLEFFYNKFVKRKQAESSETSLNNEHFHFCIIKNVGERGQLNLIPLFPFTFLSTAVIPVITQFMTFMHVSGVSFC